MSIDVELERAKHDARSEAATNGKLIGLYASFDAGFDSGHAHAAARIAELERERDDAKAAVGEASTTLLRQRCRIKQLESVLQAVEWAEHGECCPCCGRTKSEGHEPYVPPDVNPGCELDAALHGASPSPPPSTAEQPPADAAAALAKLPGKWRIVGKHNKGTQGMLWWLDVPSDIATNHWVGPVDRYSPTMHPAWWAEPVPDAEAASGDARRLAVEARQKVLQEIVTAIDYAKHAQFHFSQSNLDEEGKHGKQPLQWAIDHLEKALSALRSSAGATEGELSEDELWERHGLEVEHDLTKPVWLVLQQPKTRSRLGWDSRGEYRTHAAALAAARAEAKEHEPVSPNPSSEFVDAIEQLPAGTLAGAAAEITRPPQPAPPSGYGNVRDVKLGAPIVKGEKVWVCGAWADVLYDEHAARDWWVCSPIPSSPPGCTTAQYVARDTHLGPGVRILTNDGWSMPLVETMVARRDCWVTAPAPVSPAPSGEGKPRCKWCGGTEAIGGKTHLDHADCIAHLRREHDGLRRDVGLIVEAVRSLAHGNTEFRAREILDQIGAQKP